MVAILQIMSVDWPRPSNPDADKCTGTAEGEGLVGPRPHHFFAPPPPLFALKRKIIKIKKDLKQVFSVYIPLYSLYFL